jgi:redox-sensitive bicupin YhaK (pirin superfamily)
MQRMTAGTGVWHSEFNASNQEPVHFLQIWIFPDKQGLAPGYEQKAFTAEELADQWKLVASGKPTGNAVKIHQDVNLHIARPAAGTELGFEAKPGRIQWLQVARGQVEVDGRTLEAGDGASWTEARNIKVRAAADSEVLLFDMLR